VLTGGFTRVEIDARGCCELEVLVDGIDESECMSAGCVRREDTRTYDRIMSPEDAGL
jgi:hypothetical protein